eukprot:CAMPEP_0171737456 /NCGR_PEP_ID=MMETSP0991-20121206/32944_1 /TAXON_ID=483369 /ORGANISM="non described non described, Strain CCMP2098" /LENGTH=256 /DNA_ID=CAMNT_0012334477 /DNA_START=98 /DNA_END=866 /DNA_ORIENTATION=-
MYHKETRDHAHKIQQAGKKASRAASKRRTEAMKEKRDPSQALICVGKPSRIHARSTGAAQEQTAPAEQGLLMPWNGRADVLIDRFDVRALMDIMPSGWDDDGLDCEHDDTTNAGQGKEEPAAFPGHGEGDGGAKLGCFLNFERYRPLVEVRRKSSSSPSSLEAEHVTAVSSELTQKLSRLLLVASPSAQPGGGGGNGSAAAAAADANAPLPSSLPTEASGSVSAGVEGHYGSVGYMGASSDSGGGGGDNSSERTAS